MKNSQTLISRIIKSPSLKKLHQSTELSKIKIFLAKNIKDNLLFILSKNHQILFAFKNPVVCNEFNKYISKNLTQTLKQNAQFFPTLPPSFTLKGYVPLNQLKRHSQVQEVFVSTFTERSNGDFQNHCQDKHLHARFENLRSLIKKERAQVLSEQIAASQAHSPQAHSPQTHPNQAKQAYQPPYPHHTQNPHS